MATVTALQSFVGRLSKDTKDSDGKLVEGKSVQVRQGQNFDSNHPAVKAFPSMFGEVEQVHGIEQATAAPGEKRGR